MAARTAMSMARKGRRSTTFGKRYTLEERRNISIGLRQHYERLRTEGLLLSTEEKLVRETCRARYKQLVRRLLVHKNGKRSAALLGYTQGEFRRHIESQFKPGMSWADRASFHVDHIVPIVDFIRRGITDPKIVSALSNLQPLTRRENQTKQARIGDDMRKQVLTAHFDGGKATYSQGIA